MTFVGDGAGHVEVVGTIRDRPGTGNVLGFRVATDQTYLTAILEALSEIHLSFPILGSPEPRTPARGAADRIAPRGQRLGARWLVRVGENGTANSTAFVVEVPGWWQHRWRGYGTVR
jgi:hypothetical protein